MEIPQLLRNYAADSIPPGSGANLEVMRGMLPTRAQWESAHASAATAVEEPDDASGHATAPAPTPATAPAPTPRPTPVPAPDDQVVEVPRPKRSFPRLPKPP